jgi:ferredoxin
MERRGLLQDFLAGTAVLSVGALPYGITRLLAPGSTPPQRNYLRPPGEIDMGIAEIDQTACYPWVDRGICGACVTICPLGDRAIGFDFANVYRPVVKQGCVGCGLCVEVCPHPSIPIWIVERPQEAARKAKG